MGWMSSRSLIYIHKKYGTDFRRLFLNQYVPGEVPFLFFWREMGLYNRYKSLTANHLVEAIRLGAWSDVLNNR